MDPDSGFLDQFAFEDEDVQSSAREKRMEEAFMKSKDAYKNEFKYITSQWYLEQHSSATQSGPLNVDFTINHLFASRRYNEALALTKAQLDIPHKRGESFEANERELLDIGLRCCLECQDKDSALELAERSRSKWKQVPTLALTASKAFLLTGRPRDALSAALEASQYRSLPIYIATVGESLRACAAGPAVCAKTADALNLMADTFSALNRSRNPLFPSLGSRTYEIDTSVPTIHEKKQAPSQEQAMQWCEAGKVEGRDRMIIVELLSKTYQEEKAEDTLRGFRDL